MAYDPTKPANNAPVVSAELRNQFAGLKTLLDATQTQVNELPTRDDVTDAITNAAAGPANDVSNLTLTISNPPTQLQVQTLVEKINQLLDALKRV